MTRPSESPLFVPPPTETLAERLLRLAFDVREYERNIETTAVLNVTDIRRALEEAAVAVSPTPTFNFLTHLQRQRAFSEQTFGPGSRAHGVVDHIRKELKEIEADPGDLREWIDVVILALDGAWRSGATPEQIIAALVAKQTKNEGRVWPDWRTMPADAAIEHDRTADQEPA